jgi:hypothetical protein
VRSTAAPYTESRLTHLVRNKCVGFPVVEQQLFYFFLLFFVIVGSRIRPGWKKIGIWDKHPRSAPLKPTEECCTLTSDA